MSRKIYVTSAQRAAAQYIVERDTARGRETRPAVKKIAAASTPPPIQPSSAPPAVASKR